MKLRGEFVVRQVMEEIVAIPVGEAALQLGGIILLNDVSRVIWECLERDEAPDAMVQAVTDAFEVSPEEARTDILEFLDKLRTAKLLQE